MRTIGFRGKRNTQGIWVYGDLCRYKEGTWTINPEDENFGYEVNPNTVGEFTGLHDRNGAKIYEGDIIADKTNTRVVCEFRNGCFDFRDQNGRCVANPISAISVIVGNIYDNPELMKGEAT